MLLLSATRRFCPDAPVIEAGLKFEGKIEAVLDIAGRQGRLVVEDGEQAVFLGREAEVVVPQPEIERETRRTRQSSAKNQLQSVMRYLRAVSP